MKVNDVSFKLGREYSVLRSNWDNAQFDTRLLADIDNVQNHNNYEAAKAGDYESSLKESLIKSIIFI